ncbi:YgaP family membrane protein [Foetidibacter luteolus]|uniref:YgaP family membrane protein n=1 Tax=Foetidibacter luteolus TaxID=2608880 RepID=UPI00129AA2E6|nr:DUF2892 domain-containing protein [Foetidibacter luteolus]
MKCNVGKTDRNIRISAAILITAIGVYFTSWWALVAIVPLITAFAGFCPLYALLGINTCRRTIKVN